MALLTNHKIPSMENAVLNSEKIRRLLYCLHQRKIYFTCSYTQTNTDIGEHLLNDDLNINITSYLLNSNLIMSSPFWIDLFLYSRITNSLPFIFQLYFWDYKIVTFIPSLSFLQIHMPLPALL